MQSWKRGSLTLLAGMQSQAHILKKEELIQYHGIHKSDALKIFWSDSKLFLGYPLTLSA